MTEPMLRTGAATTEKPERASEMGPDPPASLQLSVKRMTASAQSAAARREPVPSSDPFMLDALKSPAAMGRTALTTRALDEAA